jgi:hypothetical protein
MSDLHRRREFFAWTKAGILAERCGICKTKTAAGCGVISVRDAQAKR